MSMPAPEKYPQFVSLIRRHAPRFPIGPTTALQQDRAAAGRALGAVQTLADGLDVNIPGPAGIAVSAATANNAGDFSNSMADTAITTGGVRVLGGAAGPFIGGALMLARGTFQALGRTDAMVSYLLGTGGFTNTLARLCVSAMQDPVPYTALPHPPIPDYVLRQGDIYSSWRRQAYMAGYNAAGAVISTLDELRPTSGDHYSKRCLIHVGLLTNFTGQHEELNWRLRRACEAIIVRDMLSLNLRERAEELRRWATAP